MLQLRRHASWTWSPSLEVLCYLRHRENQSHGNQSRVLSSSRLRVFETKNHEKIEHQNQNPKTLDWREEIFFNNCLCQGKKKGSRSEVARGVQFASQLQRGGEGRRQGRRLGFGGGEKRETTTTAYNRSQTSHPVNYQIYKKPATMYHPICPL